MTPEERQRRIVWLKDQERRMTSEKSLAEFVRQAWYVLEPSNAYMHGWHIDAICEHLEAVSKGQIRNLLINMPPRHAKSLICSVFWPAWEWGPLGKPQTRWLYASYAGSLSVRDSIKCRRVIQSPWYKASWGDRFSLASDQNQASKFTNDKTGQRIATSVDARGTGEGGDRIVCFRGDTLVMTDSGQVPIENIVDHRMNVRIASYDHASHQAEFQSIESYQANGYAQVSRLSFSDGSSFCCTEEHPIFTFLRGYQSAKDLVLGEEVLSGPDPVHLVSYQRTGESVPVFNLRVAKNHNYFASGVLVHNCDDPHKVMEVESDTQRKHVIDWWDTEMGSRGNDPKTVAKVIIMQRIHEGDLSGHVLEKGGFEHLKLPAEYEVPEKKHFTSIGWSDPRKVQGELLWPDRFGPPEMKELKKMGSRAAAGQLQQRPAPEDGDIVKRSWFRFYRELPEGMDFWALSCDLTFTETAAGAFNVFDVVAKKGSNKYLVHQVKERMGFTQQLKTIRLLHDTYPQLNATWIEDAANAQAVKDVLQDKVPGLILVPAGGSKPVRAEATSPQFEAGNIWLPHPDICPLDDETGEPWVNSFMDEWVKVPNNKYWDQVDASGMAFRKLNTEDNYDYSPVSMTKASTWRSHANSQ